MKKKIDRCKYNLTRKHPDTQKPYCGFHVLYDGFKRHNPNLLLPPHMTMTIDHQSELTSDICKNCKCFETWS